MTIDELPTSDELIATLSELLADLTAVQRKLDPLVDLYEQLHDDEFDDEILVKQVMQAANFAWWDVMRVMGQLRAAQRRLRDKGGSLADVEKER